MTPDERVLIRRYIADELGLEGSDIAELLILIDESAAAMVEESLIQRDRSSTSTTPELARYRSR